MKTYLEGMDSNLNDDGYVGVTYKILDPLYTEKPKPVFIFANEMNPGILYDADVIEHASHRAILLTVVQVQRDLLPKHVWEKENYKADGRILKPPQTVWPYQVFKKLNTISVKPGDLQEEDVIKRQQAPYSQWGDGIENMIRYVEEIEALAMLLCLDRSSAQLIYWFRRQIKRVGKKDSAKLLIEALTEWDATHSVTD